MMNKQTKRVLLSREERATAQGTNGSIPGEGELPGGEAGEDALEALRVKALEQGFVLRREGRPRRIKPWRGVETVRYSCRMSSNVRDALEEAKGGEGNWTCLGREDSGTGGH